MGTIIPPTPATSGRVSRLRWRSSPMSNSRRASTATTRKKKVISPEFTQVCRSPESSAPPRRNDSTVPQTVWYDCASMFTQARAATVAASRTAALPVSVRRNRRSGVRFRAHAVTSDSRGDAGRDDVMAGFSPVRAPLLIGHPPASATAAQMVAVQRA